MWFLVADNNKVLAWCSGFEGKEVLSDEIRRSL